MLKLPFIFTFCLIVGFFIRSFFVTITEVEYCGYTLEVPAGCTATSTKHLSKGKNSIHWYHVDNDHLAGVPGQVLHALKERHAVNTQREIKLKSFGASLKGLLVFHGNDTPVCELVAHGIVNNQPVVIRCEFDRTIETNEDIPDFIRQVFEIRE